MPPLQPDECAAMARRAASLVDSAALPRPGNGASFVLWQDEESIAWLNVAPDGRDTGYHDHDGSAVGGYSPDVPRHRGARRSLTGESAAAGILTAADA